MSLVNMFGNKIPAAGGGVTYATFDSAFKGANATLSNGDLTCLTTNTGWETTYLNMNKSTGKWSFEITPSGNITSTPNFHLLQPGSSNVRTLNNFIGGFATSAAYSTWDGKAYINPGSNSAAGYWDALAGTAPKIIIVFDFDNDEIYCIKAGALAGWASVNCKPYFGVGMLTSDAASYGCTLNAGQSAFSVSNEAAIVVLEGSIGAINRGVF